MIVRPCYCINNRCKIFKIAEQKVYDSFGSVSSGQNFLDNELSKSSLCEQCKKDFVVKYCNVNSIAE